MVNVGPPLRHLRADMGALSEALARSIADKGGEVRLCWDKQRSRVAPRNALARTLWPLGALG